MEAFVSVGGALLSPSSFNGQSVCVSRTSDTFSFQISSTKLHRRARTHARIQRRNGLYMTQKSPQEFNYNIYQDGEDRSKRRVGANERAVVLQKPLGLVLEEGTDGMVFVASIESDSNAAESGEIREGDVVVAVSATFGEEVWSTRGVGLDRVMKSIRIRSGDFVTLVLESPEKLSRRMSYSAQVAENRRTEARDKFGEREVIDPVTWRKQQPIYEDDRDPQQTQVEAALREKLKNEVVAPYKQNWILWISGGIFVLVILAAVLGIS